MNGPGTPYQHRSQNKYNTKKRSQHLGEELYNNKHKKFKPNNLINNIEIENKFDIVSKFRFELEKILCNTKLSNIVIENIQPYGSRISGLYTDDSDVDFNISFTSKISIKTVIQQFANELRSSQIFIKVFPLVKAKIPIIKCMHERTGINCGISFNNACAVHNSHLINHILSMDHRVKSVLMKLKTWAKSIDLISSNAFSSYSFYWLGIFVMQVMGILPAIFNLQKSVPEILVGHWNCAFSKEKREKNLSDQKLLSESDILNVIYAYYSSFNFEKYVISPYSGCMLLKKDFENEEQLPKEFWRYKQFYKENKECQKVLFLGAEKCKMYTQDPFQHNVNITARVTPKIFMKFINACKEINANK